MQEYGTAPRFMRAWFPAKRNREFSNVLQGKFLDEQGKFLLDGNNPPISTFGSKAGTATVSCRGSY
jgi:hypothetical protein